MKNCAALYVVSIESLKNLKYQLFVIKHYFFVAFVTNMEVKIKKYLKTKKNKLK